MEVSPSCQAQVPLTRVPRAAAPPRTNGRGKRREAMWQIPIKGGRTWPRWNKQDVRQIQGYQQKNTARAKKNGAALHCRQLTGHGWERERRARGWARPALTRTQAGNQGKCWPGLWSLGRLRHPTGQGAGWARPALTWTQAGNQGKCWPGLRSLGLLRHPTGQSAALEKRNLWYGRLTAANRMVQ